ncbi:MAG: 4-carboxymuconolactone decarboxylase [Rhodospirillales bacterium]|nr:4-carboxymuconolactone decarboxylase [Rhodospirillales bacterium]
MKVRRKVLGDAHVDRAEANKSEIDADFQRYIVENAWGAVWTRDSLSLRERSMLTICMMASLGHQEELAMHIRAARNTGATRQDIIEVLLQVAVYAGVPTANTAFAIAKKTFLELDSNAEK